MSPLIKIRKRDRSSQWITLDLTEDEEVAAAIVVPLFGPDHHACGDCWCQPAVLEEGRLIVHNVQH